MKILQKIIFLALLMVFASAHAYEIYNGISPITGKKQWSQSTIQVDQAGNIVAPNNDAAIRSRVSEPYGVFSDKRVYDSGTYAEWNEHIVGAGSSATFLPNESSVSLTVGTGSGDTVIRESRYLPYIPGRSMLIKMTGLLGTAGTNIVKRIGYFNNDNGLFFQQDSTGTSVCIRTSTSGTPVDTCTSQASWNMDTLSTTGNNPSNIKLDINKVQLFVIDFLWQGVGRVRFGFIVDGRLIWVHYHDTGNVATSVYMGTPTLPARYEIDSVGASAGGTMKQICVSVESEGGYDVPSKGFAISNGITTRAVTTETPILAIRLANTFNGFANRKIVRLKHFEIRATTNDAICYLEHLHNVTATVGGAWTAVDTASGVEYNTGITSITATSYHKVDGIYAISGQGSFSETSASNLEFANEHSLIFQNYDSTASQYFAVYCTAFAGTSDLTAELKWTEYE